MSPLPQLKPTGRPLAKVTPTFLGFGPRLEITKAEWDATPADLKRKHKDGTRFLVRRVRKGYMLQPVVWYR